MGDTDFEGTVVLEQLAAIGKVEDFSTSRPVALRALVAPRTPGDTASSTPSTRTTSPAPRR